MEQAELDLSASALWSVEIRANEDGLAQEISDILSDADLPQAISVTMMREYVDPWPTYVWIVRGYYQQRPLKKDLQPILPKGVGDISVERVPDKDWVTESQKGFPAIDAGRFIVADQDHWPEVEAVGHNPRFAIRINAGPGFGTGHHGSTRGCLMALDQLSQFWRFAKGQGQPWRSLDLGCGSGILAIAAARLWRRPVIASDLDESSIPFAAQLARENGVGPYVRFVHATGFNHPIILHSAPYDLVCANILARPLVKLGPDIYRHMSDRGYLILAGLYDSQESFVANTYRSYGFNLKRRIVVDGWMTLVFQR